MRPHTRRANEPRRVRSIIYANWNRLTPFAILGRYRCDWIFRTKWWPPTRPAPASRLMLACFPIFPWHCKWWQKRDKIIITFKFRPPHLQHPPTIPGESRSGPPPISAHRCLWICPGKRTEGAPTIMSLETDGEIEQRANFDVNYQFVVINLTRFNVLLNIVCAKLRVKYTLIKCWQRGWRMIYFRLSVCCRLLNFDLSAMCWKVNWAKKNW